jgi:hypothetical protein
VGTLPGFEHTLLHFEKLEKQSKDSKFNNHPGIQNFILSLGIRLKSIMRRQISLLLG